MEKPTSIKTLKLLLSIVLICMIWCASVVFEVLYLETFSNGFFYDYITLLKSISVSIISILTILNIDILGFNLLSIFGIAITIGIIILILKFMRG